MILLRALVGLPLAYIAWRNFDGGLLAYLLPGLLLGFVLLGPGGERPREEAAASCRPIPESPAPAPGAAPSAPAK